MRFTFSLIFCILNSTHGFQIFIVYIVISQKRRKILKEKLDNMLRKEISNKSISIKSIKSEYNISTDTFVENVWITTFF